MKLTGTFFVAFSLLVTGCDSGPPEPEWSTNPPTDTAATNKVRERIGLRRIKDNWTFYGRQTWLDDGASVSEEDWQDPKGHQCKRVHRDADGNIAWEQDYYYTGNTYVHVDPDAGTVFECVTTTYDYSTGRFTLDYGGVNPKVEELLGTLPDTRGRPPAETNKATFQVADRILRVLGLERL